MGREVTKPKPAPKPRISGFCNVTLPRTTAYDPHQNCAGCDCRAAGCPCNPEETPVDLTITDQDGTVLEQDGKVLQLRAAEPPPVDPESPDDAVLLLGAVADDLNTAMLGYAPEDWRDALRLLRDLRAVTSKLGQLDALLVKHLYLHGEHGERVEDGIGEVWIGRGRAKERWSGPAAINDYVDRCVEATGGEVPDPRQVIEWVLEVLPATESVKLRTTPLKAAGLDVEEYRWSEPGTLSVTLPKAT